MSLLTESAGNLAASSELTTQTVTGESLLFKGNVSMGVLTCRDAVAPGVFAQAPLSCKQALSGSDVKTGPGDVTLSTTLTRFVSTGTGDRLTLAAGQVGQVKTIVYEAKTSPGDNATLTPYNRLLGNKTTVRFNNVGDAVTMVFMGTKWAVLQLYGAITQLLFNNTVTSVYSHSLVGASFQTQKPLEVGYAASVTPVITVVRPNVTLSFAKLLLKFFQNGLYAYPVKISLSCCVAVYPASVGSFTTKLTTLALPPVIDNTPALFFVRKGVTVKSPSEITLPSLSFQVEPGTPVVVVIAFVNGSIPGTTLENVNNTSTVVTSITQAT